MGNSIAIGSDGKVHLGMEVNSEGIDGDRQIEINEGKTR